jgi:hypothetical protein
MNKLDIHTIVEDILRLDPTLVSKKAEVEKLITAMLVQKPNITVDDAFLSRLRSRLVDQIEESQSKSFSFGQLFVSHKLVFAGVLGCLTVGVVSASFLYSPVPSTRIAHANGFGSLVTQVENVPESASFSDVEKSTSALIDRDALGGVTTKMMMLPPGDNYEYGQMEFVLSGDVQIQKTEEMMPVYGFQASTAVGKIADASMRNVWKELFGSNPDDVLGRAVSGLVTVNKQVYDFGIDVNTSVISLLRHDSDQLSGYYHCRKSSDPCFPFEPLLKSDLPTDIEILTLAKDTLSALSIDTSGYGEPVVLPPPIYTLYTEAGMPVDTVSDTVDVLYPLSVGGVAVVDSTGANTVGMRLSISIRDMAVASINDIPAGPLVSSKYALVTDTDRIAALALLGGQYGMWGQKTAEPLVLGAPTLIYTSIWKQDPQTYVQKMLFVPAYQFNITYPTEFAEQQYRSKSLIIPLEKELFEQAERDALNRQNQGEYPTPMPWIRTMEAGSSEGSVGEAGESAVSVDPVQ